MKKVWLLIGITSLSLCNENKNNAEEAKKPWFGQMKEAVQNVANDIFQYGSREWRCFRRRQLTPEEKFAAVTELDSYKEQVWRDLYYELQQVKKPSELKEVSYTYAHHYTLPLLGTIFLLNHRPISFAVLVAALYGAKKIYAQK